MEQEMMTIWQSARCHTIPILGTFTKKKGYEFFDEIQEITATEYCKRFAEFLESNGRKAKIWEGKNKYNGVYEVGVDTNRVAGFKNEAYQQTVGILKAVEGKPYKPSGRAAKVGGAECKT